MCKMEIREIEGHHQEVRQVFNRMTLLTQSRERLPGHLGAQVDIVILQEAQGNLWEGNKSSLKNLSQEDGEG